MRVIGARYIVIFQSMQPKFTVKLAVMTVSVIMVAVSIGVMCAINSTTTAEQTYQAKIRQATQKEQQHDLLSASLLYQEALSEARRSHNSIAIINTQIKIAGIAKALKNIAEAKSYLQEAEQRAAAANQGATGSIKEQLLRTRIDALQQLSQLFAQESNYAEADKACTTALSLAKEPYGSTDLEDTLLQEHASLLAKQGKTSEATALETGRKTVLGGDLDYYWDYYSAGKAAYNKGKVKDANRNYLVACNIARHSNNRERQVQALACVSECLFSLGETSAADKTLATAEQLISAQPQTELSPVTAVDKAVCLVTKACILAAQSKTSDAKQSFLSAVNLQKKTATETMLAIVKECDTDSEHHNVQALNRLASLCEKDPIGRDDCMIDSLIILAKINWRTGRSDLFKEQITAARNAGAPSARLLQTISELCDEYFRDPRKLHLSDLAEVLEGFTTDDVSMNSAEYSTCLLQLAQLYETKGDWKKAVTQLKKAQELLQQQSASAANGADRKIWLMQQARCEQALAFALSSDSTSRDLKQSIACWHQCLQHLIMTDGDIAELYLSCEVGLSDTLTLDNKFTGAEATLEDGMRTANKFKTKASDQTLAEFHHRWGNFAQRRRAFSLAEEHYRLACQLYEATHQKKNAPSNGEWKARFSECQRQLAGTYLADGKATAAKDCFRESMKSAYPQIKIEECMQTAGMIAAALISERKFESADQLVASTLETVHQTKPQLSLQETNAVAELHQQCGLSATRVLAWQYSINQFGKACNLLENELADAKANSQPRAACLARQAECEFDLALVFRDGKPQRLDRSIVFWHKCLQDTLLASGNDANAYVIRALPLSDTLLAINKRAEAESLLKNACHLGRKSSPKLSDNVASDLRQHCAKVALPMMPVSTAAK